MNNRLGKILFLAFVLSFLGCDYGSSPTKPGPILHEDPEMRVSFKVKPDYIINSHHDSINAGISIYSKNPNLSWIMGAERRRSSATLTNDSDDIETMILILSGNFPTPPLRSTRMIASAGTYILLSGEVLPVKDSLGMLVNLFQEIYFLSKNGGIFIFTFSTKISELDIARREFEDFFTSIIFK